MGRRKPFYGITVMRHLRTCTAVIALFSLYGCTKIPQHDLAEQTSSSCLDSSECEALSSGQFSEGEWPSEAWWEDYGDPNLNQLIQAALESSPTLKSAEERMKVAIQGANSQRGYLFPEIDLMASDTWWHVGKNTIFRHFAPNIPPAFNQIDLDLIFSYEFDFWGKNRAAYEAALGEASAYRADLAQSTLILTTSIAYSYFQYQLTSLQLELLKKIARNHGQQDSLAKNRFTNALDTAIQEEDVLQSSLEAQKAVIAAEEDLKVLEVQIKALSGLGQDAKIVISPPGSIADDRFLLPSNISLDLLARRPDLESKRWLAEQAAQEIHVAKTAFYPDINLLAVAGLDSVKFNQFFKRQSALSILRPAFNLPIFTAGRLRADLMGKAAQFSQAVQDYNALVIQAAEEVATQITKIIKIAEQIALQQKIVESAMHNSQLTLQRFKGALDPLSDVLSRFNTQSQEEIALAQLQYGRRLASILLIRALGGGYQRD